MNQKLKKVVFVLIASPFLIWTLLHFPGILKEWKKMPDYFRNNIHSIISSDKLSKVDEERWNSFGSKNKGNVAKIFYNKGTVILDDLFTVASNLNPRVYFQAGDGTNLSPPKVEPLVFPLFVFWIIGLLKLIKYKNFKLILWSVFFAFFVYIFGQRNMAYLFPILIIYLIISIKGVDTISNIKFRNSIYLTVSIYGLFLLGRMMLL